MKKPTKNLFEKGMQYSSSRKYEFVNLLGEKDYYWLSPDESLVDRKCPICGNYIIVGHGYMDSWVICQACKIDPRDLTLEKYKKMIEKTRLENLEKIEVLNKKIEKESKILKILNKKLKK